MEAKKYTIQNQARDTPVSTGVTAINSTLEPLAALRVMVEGVELLPASEIPRFKKPSASVLVLPFRTISSAKIEPGDQLSLQEISEEEAREPEENKIEI